MKKTIFGILISMFLFAAVFAAAGAGTGQTTESGETQNQGDETQLLISTQTKAGNVNELQQMIQERSQQISEETETKKGAEAKAYQNQNSVREAVHNLQAMEGLLGGIGPQVSEVAREFNNGLDNSLDAEEKIQSKGAFARLFTGGDKEAGESLEQQVNQNNEKIQELKQLHQNCEGEACDILQEQIQNMEQEQERLGKLAEENKNRKGLLGWMWK